MDQEADLPDQINSTSKTPIRRRYEDAFSSEEEDVELEQHIVPQPTIPVEGSGESSDLERGNTEEEDNVVQNRFSCQVPSCVLTFSTAGDYQTHYNTRHMHSCSICKRNLPSSHILELHVLELHDSWFSLMAEKKPMYQCFLESCLEKFQSPEVRKEHCIKEHKFTSKFHYWDCNPPRNHHQKVNNTTTKKGGSTKKMNAKSKQNVAGSSGSINTDSKSTNKNNNNDDKTEDLLMEIDVASNSTDKSKCNKESLPKTKVNNSDTNKQPSRSVPKHIAFGRAPHRAFQNAYTVATDPTKINKKRSNGKEDNTSLIDMKDVEEALVVSSSMKEA